MAGPYLLPTDVGGNATRGRCRKMKPFRQSRMKKKQAPAAACPRADGLLHRWYIPVPSIGGPGLANNANILVARI